LIITDIYSVGEEPLLGVTSQALAEKIKKRGTCTVQTLPREKVVPFLLQKTREGDLVLTMGAGDVWELGHSFWEELQKLDAKDIILAREIL
ncbi:MAG: UDP-N-acetylmuramate--L-alanine ligase, partial [Firmicutes bacterium]|nr:UDP-N-acetylmuramate--L-alanine ligase [Bacillota bacterium]